MTDQPKRILLHCAVPWAPSGYGLQGRFMAEALKRLGYEVAVSAYGGVYPSEFNWHGIQILGTGGRAYGNGTIDINYRRFNADLVITLGDVCMWEAPQFKGMNVMPIMPLDCEPLGIMDSQWLEQASQVAASLHPTAMSQFGQRMLKNAGYDAAVVPHATTFRPSDELRAAWRMGMQIPEDMFLISKVGVNDDDDRKAFNETLHAYEIFSRGRENVGLYLHTEAQVRGKRVPNLVYMSMTLGLNKPGHGRVAFCDQDARIVDGFDQDYMRAMYCATDVYDGATKAEGFGCPVIDALGCGTPVIVTNNSAMPEKVEPKWGWTVSGQATWPVHHQSNWKTPSINSLVVAYEEAYKRARDMRPAAAKAGFSWSVNNMKNALEAALKEVFNEA